MEKIFIKVIKALADENRLRLLNLLYQNKLCVCEIEEILSMNQANVSRHLNKLKDTGIIQSEKKGQFVFHSINMEILNIYPFIDHILKQTSQFLNYLDDKKKLDLIIATKGLHCAG